MSILRHLKARHWAWAAVLAIAGIWWPAFIIGQPPEFVLETLAHPDVLNFCMGVALVGAIIKIVGYLASQAPGKPGVVGVSVELAGLILTSIGPVAYLVVSAYALFEGTQSAMIPNSATIFACALLMVYVYRAIIIVPRFFFEATDSAKDDF